MKQKKHRANRSHTPEPASRTLLFSALRTLAVTLITTVLLAVGAAALLCTMSDPVLGVRAAAYACLALSSAIGGITARLTAPEHAEATAALAGGMLAMLLLVFSVSTGGMTRPLFTLLGYAAVVAVHTLTAAAVRRLFGARRRKHRHY